MNRSSIVRYTPCWRAPLPREVIEIGLKRWILIVCGWTIVGVLFTVEAVVLAKVDGGHVNWVAFGAIELIYWNVWAAFTPLVVRLAKSYPLTGPGLVGNIATHAIASLFVAPLATVSEYALASGFFRIIARFTTLGSPSDLPSLT